LWDSSGETYISRQLAERSNSLRPEQLCRRPFVAERYAGPHDTINGSQHFCRLPQRLENLARPQNTSVHRTLQKELGGEFLLRPEQLSSGVYDNGPERRKRRQAAP